MTTQTINLFNSASQFVKKLLASDAASGDIYELFRMSRGTDSVRASVTRKLDRMASQNAN